MCTSIQAVLQSQASSENIKIVLNFNFIRGALSELFDVFSLARQNAATINRPHGEDLCIAQIMEAPIHLVRAFDFCR